MDKGLRLKFVSVHALSPLEFQPRAVKSKRTLQARILTDLTQIGNVQYSGKVRRAGANIPCTV